MTHLILDSAIMAQILQVLANVEGPPAVVAEAEQAEAALRAALKVQPTCGKWVPVQPTEAMLDAGCEAVDGPDWTGPNAVYRAMLDAAPQLPVAEQNLKSTGDQDKAVTRETADSRTATLGSSWTFVAWMHDKKMSADTLGEKYGPKKVFESDVPLFTPTTLSEKPVAQVCSVYYGGKPPAAASIEIICESAAYHALPIHEGDLLYRQPQAPLQPLTAEQLKAEFAKLYPNDAGLLELAENNRDFMLESIGTQHHWNAFERGARAVERVHEIK